MLICFASEYLLVTLNCYFIARIQRCSADILIDNCLRILRSKVFMVSQGDRNTLNITVHMIAIAFFFNNIPNNFLVCHVEVLQPIRERTFISSICVIILCVEVAQVTNVLQVLVANTIYVKATVASIGSRQLSSGLGNFTFIASRIAFSCNTTIVAGVGEVLINTPAQSSALFPKLQ